MRNHFVTQRFLSQNKLLIPPLFLTPSNVAYVQFNRKQMSYIFITHGSPTFSSQSNVPGGVKFDAE